MAYLERFLCAGGAGNFLLEVESVPTKKKVELVEELRDKFSRCAIAVATDYTGLNVNAMTELREKMREKEVEYRVVKNTLAYLAADAAQNPQIKEIVQGPTALAFGYDDPVEVARVLEEYIRVNRSALTIRGAVMDRRSLTPAQVMLLPRLPSKNQLLAQVLGQIQSPLANLLMQLQAPMAQLLTVLSGPLGSLTIVLQRRMEQLKSQEEST